MATRSTKATKSKAAAAKKPAAEKKLTPTERAESAEARAARAESKLQKLRETASVTRQVDGFVEFLREQSVVGLAIGLVLGTQAKALVDQLVTSFINPLTGLLLPGEGTLKTKTIAVSFHHKTAVLGWGAFAYSLLTFFIVAGLVYYVFKGLRLDKLDKKKEGK